MPKFKYYLFSILLLPAISFGAPDKVAKVIIMRGKVQAKTGANDSKQLKKGMWLSEGTIVKTSPKSFVKLIFIDKSQMNLGPKSQMKITAFPKKKAGIITLMKGQLRSKVTKDYMGIQNKNKSKLFIKTKTAAMGVRGTDFQVNFNPKNLTTALVTFEGAVAMAQLGDTMKNLRASQGALERMVSSDQAVMVKRGQYSGASPKQLRATTPVKINPAQLKVMEKNDGSQAKASNKSKGQGKKLGHNKKKFRNIVPPGMDAKMAANTDNSVDKVVTSAVGSSMVKRMDAEVKAEQSPTGTTPPPEGMHNRITGEMAPTAGGYVDMATALYIPPPPGSAFDPTTETYIPPPEFGGFDAGTGEYVNSTMTLTDEGTFVMKEQPLIDDGRAPASEGGDLGEPAPTGEPVMELATCFDCAPSGEIQYDEFGNPMPPPDQQYQELADEAIHDFNNDHENSLEQNIIDNRTRVKFIFNAN
ncbi:MAG: FecR domain-containing protein [Bacteriovoracaceae bacterium]|nr:FecR domain-containing protein [Bacteriovoracaceae bacterium]